MTSGLHGGGVPFVSDMTIGEINDSGASGQDIDALKFSSPVTVDDMRAALTLEKVSDTGPDDKPRFKIEFEGSARTVLGLPEYDEPVQMKSAAALTGAPPLPATSPNLYFKLVDTTGVHTPLSDSLLQKIAVSMHTGAAPSAAPRIPAIYTYFGQFIAHDLTHMQYTGTPGTEFSHRSHVFDLDSIFDALPPGIQAFGDQLCLPNLPSNPVCIGLTSAQNRNDIPRSFSGYPCITDARNDNNLVVSQLFLAIARLIHKLQKLNNHTNISDLKIEASRYLQSIILTDYLPTICDPGVLQDIKNPGPRVVFPTITPSVFHVPTEFAAACFRFGHSMISDDYPWNAANETVTLSDLLNFTHLGQGMSSFNYGRLPDDWVIDWAMFQGPNGFSDHINPQLSYSLSNLSHKWVDQNSDLPIQNRYDLSYVTLYRANQLELANAQQLICFLETAGVSISPLLGGSALFESSDAIGAALNTSEKNTLNANTPIWLYILREAELAGTGKLGQVGSRIVAETIIASIESSQNNILTGDPFIVAPQLVGPNSAEFTLNDLIRIQSIEV